MLIVYQFFPCLSTAVFYRFLFSICPERTTGSFGSPASQESGRFSSSFTAFHPGYSMRLPVSAIHSPGRNVN